MHVKGDIILILIVAVLLVVAMIPEKRSDQPPAARAASQPINSGNVDFDTSQSTGEYQFRNNFDHTLSALEQHQSDLEKVNMLTRRQGRSSGNPQVRQKYAPPAAPVQGASVIPLIPGSVWQYQVFGDEKLVPEESWTFRIVNAPKEHLPGTAEVRFGKEVTVAELHVNDGSIRIDDFPLVAPIELAGTRTTSADGELLPPQVRMIEGAVWNEIQHRELIYTYRDKKGVSHSVNANAVIRNRAHVREFEQIVVPAGQFGAYRVEWISRVDIKAEGRPILEHLTAAPYRRETMWIATGIGIVKRDIDFLRDGKKEHSVTFALETSTQATVDSP